MDISLITDSEVDEKIIEPVKRNLAKKKIFLKPIDKIKISGDHYNQIRQQYMAYSIIDNIKENAVIVTGKDLCTKLTSFVFHVAEFDSPSIISFHRLTPEFNKEKNVPGMLTERLTKEIIYAVGCMIGIKKCHEKCIMNEAKTIKDIDKKPYTFCGNCQTTITLLGIDIG